MGSSCGTADSWRAGALSCSSHKLFPTCRGTSSSRCCRTVSRKIRYHWTLNLLVGRQGPTTMPTLDYKIWIFCSYCRLCEFINGLSLFRSPHPLRQITFAEIIMRMRPSSVGASDRKRQFKYLSWYQHPLFLFSIVTLEVFWCAVACISKRSRHTACSIIQRPCI